jgi:magnesium-transporting ATPase (P-type)
MAIDNDFLLLQPSPQIVRQLKLFARISPENKALIVRRFKDQ